MMTYQIKLDVFEGPLDLLLHLIDKEEMDIYDIPIAKITDQYLQYIHTMQTLKLDITSEFLVMAATLLSIKSKMLLPTRTDPSLQQLLEMDIDEVDPREELIHRLLEYKKYKQLAGVLREKEIARNQIFTRPPYNLTPYLVQEKENPVEGISLYHLVHAFEKALIKYSYREPLTKVEREEISVKDKMIQVINLLKTQGILYFSELITSQATRTDIVITFLSILELMKQKRIYCIQNKTFDDIVIHYSSDKGGTEFGLQSY